MILLVILVLLFEHSFPTLPGRWSVSRAPQVRQFLVSLYNSHVIQGIADIGDLAAEKGRQFVYQTQCRCRM